MVFEVRDQSILRRVYIIDPSEQQFYRIARLDEHVHFQLRGSAAVEAYIENVQELGLRKRRPSEINANSNMFYTVLNAQSDHFLPEISVVNSFPSSIMDTNIKRMNLRKWGEKIISGCESDDSSQTRGNDRIDIGFTAQSHNDPGIIQGMNVPRFTTKHDRSPGLEENETLTMSLMRSAISMKRLVDEMKDKYKLKWDDFNNGERRSLFSQRVANDRGIEDGESFVYEGVTVGLTGALPNGKYLWLRPHRDRMNAIRDGYNVYHGFSIHFRIRYAGFRHSVLIRVALGGYGRKYLDDCLSRLEINKSILNGVLDWENDNPELFEITPSLLKFSGERYYRTIRPRADKSVYYSIFIEGLLRLGDMCDNDLGVLYEAVFLMTLTPSPLGWFEGVMFAAKNRGSENLVEVFINHMVEEHDCVSYGPGRRRQVSHGRSLTLNQLYSSLINMKRCVELASLIDDCEQLFKRWTSTYRKGGVHGAGELIGQEQMTILSYLAMLGDKDHTSSACVAKSTETHTRLSSLGVKSRQHMAELVRFVMVNIGADASFVENVLCEFLRDTTRSSFAAKDTIIRGQGLFSREGGSLYRMDEDGRKEFIEDREWLFGRVSYRSGRMWWEPGFQPESLEGGLVLSTKKRTRSRK